MPNPRLPRDPADPTGQGPNRRRANKRIEKKFILIARDIREVVSKLPREATDGETTKAYKSEMRKADLKANKQYTWQIDNWLMDQTMSTIRRILIDSLLSGDDYWTSRWWMNGHLDAAYQQGTLSSVYSAQTITAGIDVPSANAIAIMEAEAQLMTPTYLSRLQLMHGRVFEEMKGIVGWASAELRRVMTDGMARGLGIRDITGMVNDRVGVGMSRAQRIARTEINKAYTDAYMDESKELNKNLEKDDLVIRQMHLSALTSTTRRDHALRHGTIHTIEAQRKWWDSGSNRINCYCSTADVLVSKKTGLPRYSDKFVERTRERGEQYFKVVGVL